MSNATDRFQLPYILPGQAQKELFHNEALARLDAALHPAVEEGPLAMEPVAPLAGQSWIVALEASGDWAGKDGQIASFTDGGWRFVVPQPGMGAWDKQAGLWLVYNGVMWSDGALPAKALVVNGQQVVGQRLPPIVSPSGGAVIDEEARTAIDQIIATFMSHGLTD